MFCSLIYLKLHDARYRKTRLKCELSESASFYLARITSNCIFICGCIQLSVFTRVSCVVCKLTNQIN